MDALTALLGRHTTPPAKMGEPGPDEAALHRMLEAAAAAVQNLLVAAHALGFASKWASGRPAASAGVRRGLGLAENERILGILYLGSERVPQPPGERPRPEEIAEPWPSP